MASTTTAATNLTTTATAKLPQPGSATSSTPVATMTIRNTSTSSTTATATVAPVGIDYHHDYDEHYDDNHHHHDDHHEYHHYHYYNHHYDNNEHHDHHYHNYNHHHDHYDYKQHYYHDHNHHYYHDHNHHYYHDHNHHYYHDHNYHYYHDHYYHEHYHHNHHDHEHYYDHHHYDIYACSDESALSCSTHGQAQGILHVWNVRAGLRLRPHRWPLRLRLHPVLCPQERHFSRRHRSCNSEVARKGSHIKLDVLRGTAFARGHMGSTGGQNTLRNYWTTKKIFHYGVLNLEVKPWEAVPIDNRVKQAFDFLKAARAQQEMLKTAHPGPPSPARGFVVLGIRLWPANMAPFLAAIDNEFKSFMVDGLIPLTHINEDEFVAGYTECWISGGAPYQLALGSNNSNVLGMYCTSLNPYENPTLDVTQNVVVGTSRNIRATDVLSTFESRLTINSKLCDINERFRNLDIGLAVFDLECEDWSRRCPAPTAAIYSTYRFRNVSQQTHMLAQSGVANVCR
ncbi:uncharacterized protein LOC119445182 [Dermacentor silvarum]|uniref:uncharacterized protein LOC119445182 n=1 Tax=Dermacentor silvarum TaxID=543639 RepID=UPI002101189D|nr:uncharacterized protein LOC119445182 [Dermacentor silvarum]